MAKSFRRDYLIISIFPLIFLLVIGLFGVKYTEIYLNLVITESFSDLSDDAGVYVRNLAESVLANKSHDIARQMEIYINDHPNHDLNDLQNDPEFLKIALQTVGKSGFTSIFETPEKVLQTDPAPFLINKKLDPMTQSRSDWHALVKPILSAREGTGYYDWKEINGRIIKKIMTVAPVDISVGNKTLLVAATANLNEFMAPIRKMEYSADEIAGRYRQFAGRQALLINAVALLVLVAIFLGVYILNHRFVLKYIRPIERLSDAATNICEDNWEFTCPSRVMRRKDEIGTLARAFDGMSQHVQGLISDLKLRLEEVKQARAARQESENHYHILFNSIPIGLYRTNPDGKVIDVNTALALMLGFKEDQTWSDYHADQFYADPSQRSKWKKKMETNVGIYVWEVQFRRIDGTLIWVEDHAHAVRDDNGAVKWFEGSLKDITESKKAEIALRENKRNYKTLYEESQRAQQVYRSLIHSSADAIVISDLAGNTQYISPVFTEWFGWTIEELEGRPIPFVPEPEKPETEALMQMLVADGAPCQAFSTKRFTRQGRVIDVSISASRFDDHEKKPAGILTIMRDISERKKLQAQLQHAERMEAIGTLAGGIAHDFNNLMMGMQGNVSLLLFGMNDDHPFYQKLKGIENMISSGSKLTRHLLGYARKGKYESQPMDLNKLLQITSETFGRTRREITLHLQLADQINSIEADRIQIEQVLMNLYINAGDAMPNGGDLFLRTQMLAHDQFGPKNYDPHPGSYVLLTVTDTGDGINPEHIKRIFDPFFTTKEMGRGTGLGLASVYGIVKAHGGYIDVHSKLGQGTTFEVYLPSTNMVVEETLKAQEHVVKGKGTILIVDDEAVVIEVCRDMLEKAGYSVESAFSGKEAVAVYRKKHDKIDLVILDMIMPRMSGGEVFDEIKAICADAKVLLASGYSIEGQAAQILKRGCDGFIQKPFSLQQLSRKIEEILTDK